MDNFQGSWASGAPENMGECNPLGVGEEGWVMVWQSLEGWIPGLDFQQDRCWLGGEGGRDPPDRRNGSCRQLESWSGPVWPGTAGAKFGKTREWRGEDFKAATQASEYKTCAHTWPKHSSRRRVAQGQGRPGTASVVRLRGRLSLSVSADWGGEWGPGSWCQSFSLVYKPVRWLFCFGSNCKEFACNAGDLGSVPGLGRCPGGGKGYPLQYSVLENSHSRGAWRATVHGVEKSWTRLSNWTQHTFC